MPKSKEMDLNWLTIVNASVEALQSYLEEGNDTAPALQLLRNLESNVHAAKGNIGNTDARVELQNCLAAFPQLKEHVNAHGVNKGHFEGSANLSDDISGLMADFIGPAVKALTEDD